MGTFFFLPLVGADYKEDGIEVLPGVVVLDGAWIYTLDLGLQSAL